MKISALITLLEEARAKHGDVEVAAWQNGMQAPTAVKALDAAAVGSSSSVSGPTAFELVDWDPEAARKVVLLED